MADQLAIWLYGDDTLAMYIDNVRRVIEVTTDRPLNEVVLWGMGRKHARNGVEGLLSDVPAALDKARKQTDAVPPELLSFVDEQRRRLIASI